MCLFEVDHWVDTTKTLNDPSLMTETGTLPLTITTRTISIDRPKRKDLLTSTTNAAKLVHPWIDFRTRNGISAWTHKYKGEGHPPP